MGRMDISIALENAFQLFLYSPTINAFLDLNILTSLVFQQTLTILLQNVLNLIFYLPESHKRCLMLLFGNLNGFGDNLTKFKHFVYI